MVTMWVKQCSIVITVLRVIHSAAWKSSLVHADLDLNPELKAAALPLLW